eukprot:NODE_25160_length_597_cov_2.212766.p1 GENE.NODE_25160_length_597_cov_2.212766~~NODE_25160_length_597_cov_2.212766.p1  ORF type:complete len:177 (-),score=62.00 NODE_25160_length_597_cov_2.212766:66-557(-)
MLDAGAENSRRHTAETLTKDTRIRKAIKRYQCTSGSEKSKGILVDQTMARVFHLFDVDGSSNITFDEWHDVVLQFASRFSHFDHVSVEESFWTADKNNDKRVDFEEFREALNGIINGLGVPFREVLDNLAEIEREVRAKQAKRTAACAGLANALSSKLIDDDM